MFSMAFVDTFGSVDWRRRMHVCTSVTRKVVGSSWRLGDVTAVDSTVAIFF